MNTSQTTLSDRERDILVLIAKEMTTPEIANRLYLSGHTVISHRRNLLKKLNARNMAGLIYKAILAGELHPRS